MTADPRGNKALDIHAANLGGQGTRSIGGYFSTTTRWAVARVYAGKRTVPTRLPGNEYRRKWYSIAGRSIEGVSRIRGPAMPVIGMSRDSDARTTGLDEPQFHDERIGSVGLLSKRGRAPARANATSG
jgi:hypothetical protein